MRPAAQREKLRAGGVPRRRLVEPFLATDQELVGGDHQGVRLAAGDAGGFQLGEQEGGVVGRRAVRAGRPLDLRLVDMCGLRLDGEAGAAQQGEARRRGAGEDQAGRIGVWHLGALMQDCHSWDRRRGARHIPPAPLSSRPGMMTDLPNLLTLSRIAAIPLIVALVAVRNPAADLAACVVFSAAAITDYFDGRIARFRRQTSDLGRMLDPIADKLLVGATLMMLAGMGRLPGLSLYPAVVILLREILVSGLREYLAGIRIGLPVTRLAKWKTGFQMGALGTLLAGDSSAAMLHLGFLPVSLIGEAMLCVAAVLTLTTGWDYLTAGLRHASGVAADRRAAPTRCRRIRDAMIP